MKSALMFTDKLSCIKMPSQNWRRKFFTFGPHRKSKEAYLAYTRADDSFPQLGRHVWCLPALAINAEVTAVQIHRHPRVKIFCLSVQSLEDLHTSRVWQPWWWAKECPQPISPYYIIENSPTSFAHNSVLIGPNNFKFGTKTRCMVLQAT